MVGRGAGLEEGGKDGKRLAWEAGKDGRRLASGEDTGSYPQHLEDLEVLLFPNIVDHHSAEPS
jgi:hypothetical protein